MNAIVLARHLACHSFSRARNLTSGGKASLSRNVSVAVALYIHIIAWRPADGGDGGPTNRMTAEAHAAPAMGDWETSKENFQPLKAGRKPGGLKDSTVELRKAQLEAQRRQGTGQGAFAGPVDRLVL